MRHASFVDGRTPLAVGSTATVSINDGAALLPPITPSGRYIFNMSFCGSTYMSRLLDVPGTSLVLKEPRALTDLAAWKTLRLKNGQDTAGFGNPVRLVRHAMFRRFQPNEKVVVKPACWANNIIPELMSEDRQSRAIFVTIDRPGFLTAVFRGGGERIEHTARLAWHMATVFADGEEMFRKASEAAKGDNRQMAANYVVLAHALQSRVFDEMRHRVRWSTANVIDFRELLASPLEAARQATKVLDLDNNDAALAANVRHLQGTHAKDLTQAFSLAQQEKRDRRIVEELGPTFDAAMAWADATIGQRSLTPAA